MISDVLFEAEQDIEAYLKDSIYDGELRERIEHLLVEMRAIRALPGMDIPPTDKTTGLTDALGPISESEGMDEEEVIPESGPDVHERAAIEDAPETPFDDVDKRPGGAGIL